jgi:hypothetical protein
LANIDVALDCQSKGQPVGGSVEDLRSCLQRKLKQEAREMAPLDGAMPTKAEGKDVPEYRDQKYGSDEDLTKVLAG